MVCLASAGVAVAVARMRVRPLCRVRALRRVARARVRRAQVRARLRGFVGCAWFAFRMGCVPRTRGSHGPASIRAGFGALRALWGPGVLLGYYGARYGPVRGLRSGVCLLGLRERKAGFVDTHIRKVGPKGRLLRGLLGGCHGVPAFVLGARMAGPCEPPMVAWH